jgi:ComF family protein
VDLVQAVLDLLLPPRCGGCARLGAWLCADCRRAARRLEEPLCRRCGAELESAGSTCHCAARLRWITRIRSAAAYEGPVERAIHRLKYDGWRPLARPLAALVADRLAIEGLGAELIVAVPLHPRRQRSRGFNQSELIAAELRRRLRLRAAAGRLLKVRDTPAQVGLDRFNRQENVNGAFFWKGPSLEGRAIAVVDDVTTTGATLDACAGALREAGAGPVLGLTVAGVRI